MASTLMQKENLKPTRPGHFWRWLCLVLTGVSLLIIFVFLVGLPPTAGAIDYTRNIPLTEAIGYSWTNWNQGSHQSSHVSRSAIFAPFAIAGLTTFMLMPSRRYRMVIAVVNAVLPVCWLGILWPIMVAFGLPIFLMAITGQCDGEYWSEGFVSYAALGSWTFLWSILTVAIFFDKKKLKIGMCPICDYDLRATPTMCPECGWGNTENHPARYGE